MIWVIACIGGIIYSIRNLSTYSNEQKSKLPATATDVIEIQSERETGTEDFETKLRKLESLKKDGLITDEEYKQKRKEIMDKKW
jgi:cytochrome c-type biogenesis protein CcmH/NrfG